MKIPPFTSASPKRSFPDMPLFTPLSFLEKRHCNSIALLKQPGFAARLRNGVTSVVVRIEASTQERGPAPGFERGISYRDLLL